MHNGAKVAFIRAAQTLALLVVQLRAVSPRAVAKLDPSQRGSENVIVSGSPSASSYADADSDSSSTPKAMDVILANGLTDDNGFGLNPVWRQPLPDICTFCPCGQNDTPQTWNAAPNCTSQSIHQNRRDLCTHSSIGGGTAFPIT